jgi:hypothetical protein
MTWRSQPLCGTVTGDIDGIPRGNGAIQKRIALNSVVPELHDFASGFAIALELTPLSLVPFGFPGSVSLLREISPTLYFDAPRGFDMLLPYLEDDRRSRRSEADGLKGCFIAQWPSSR